MLGNVILLTPQLQSPEVSASSLTNAIVKLSARGSQDKFEVLCNGAVSLIDTYLTVGNPSTAHNEKSFIDIHNGDMNAFLKAENLGKEGHSPLLVQALAIQNAAFGMSGGKKLIAEALIS